ncbi:bifunctional ADP-dependent NAD(P)H-hydrate dehydratase/NAD(P)H-hydrate epimerase [Arthrobacter sp. OY3WO11]|uniref:bifunctional ADP-dependent NAD(P)H-hydrate dehydratase/NAD(P)H-hydrate epimerase n=1 Tax=Arthrobacter sp. OY3WO11 TaxID=1835723 RepID=UPI0007CF6FEF|nr:bifunctional ADP-dependent NAD(P)H-hydrate dehydratase/NAD(P)H-hydrate epimerase [Arthrobacter sp. OY3WO11]OAE02508.1 bifunctional ADP-dependent (S)-NAD(P)H-hydrate dehydratase/NAD(P)H-hydrate epimerase [Arthrobacter sp. OY3WO11]
MISAYTGTQVRQAEEPLLAAGLGDVLMQRAAHGLANAVIMERRSRGLGIYGASVFVLAGKGNNGGDGLYAASFLAARGMRTTAVLTGDTAHPQALAAFERANGRVHRLDGAAPAELAAETARADVVIDAVLGTGAKGGLRGSAASLVAAVAGLLEAGAGQAFVVACDLPSGVDADTGEAFQPVLPAELTVAFGGAKSGLLADPGADYAGRLMVVPIGIEEHLPQPSLRRLDDEDLARLLPHPARRAHKYSRGVLGVVAGSVDYPGAAVLACRGALAAGVGMVRYLGPPEVADQVRQACPEVVCSTGAVADNRVQAWLVGSGMGPEHHEQLQRARDAVGSGLPVVADAGALPALPDVLGPHMVLTPHAGELASLLQRLGGSEDRDVVEAQTLAAVRRASELTGATVLLKGATTLVATPSGDVFSQADGTPWLATAGSGDVLAGVIGALLAQAGNDVGRFSKEGVEPDVRWAAIAALGAALHGKAGRAASDASAGGPVTAGGIADSLPQTWGKVSTLSNSGVRKRNSHTQPLR